MNLTKLKQYYYGFHLGIPFLHRFASFADCGKTMWDCAVDYDGAYVNALNM